MHEYLPFRTGPRASSPAPAGASGTACRPPSGVALARPDQQVIALLGDGSSMYSSQALWSGRTGVAADRVRRAEQRRLRGARRVRPALRHRQAGRHRAARYRLRRASPGTLGCVGVTVRRAGPAAGRAVRRVRGQQPRTWWTCTSADRPRGGRRGSPVGTQLPWCRLRGWPEEDQVARRRGYRGSVRMAAVLGVVVALGVRVLAYPGTAAGGRREAADHLADRVLVAGQNTPPGSSVVGRPVLHKEAGGQGTFADPITVAVPGHEGAMAWQPGTKFYLPVVGAALRDRGGLRGGQAAGRYRHSPGHVDRRSGRHQAGHRRLREHLHNRQGGRRRSILRTTCRGWPARSLRTRSAMWPPQAADMGTYKDSGSGDSGDKAGGDSGGGGGQRRRPSPPRPPRQQ